ncbi:hypothetical protein K1T71_014207 [Dendrolimus kikuchii]|uniref:Uncharacterized protein n=1 Tax=Dendrolimus kikuchii TaxID=765133 RepID=A0ACC1CFC1_9NEOP|nr:hypothetical protein K1T71_014207 [Dendrolimus kikuchii]
MYAKLFILCAVAVAALAREYPAGVHPAICPNYPYCDSATLARFTPQGMPIPEWVSNPSILPQPVYAAPPAAKYPADFPPALCPNYPYCH